METPEISTKRAYMLWAIASGLLFYEILLRVFPNIIITSLQSHFALSPTNLGIFSAAFILAYGIMQVPAGMLIDKYGVKLTLTFCMLLAGVDVFLLPFLQGVWAARISRFLMGASCAGCFLTCMQVIRFYFPPHLRAILTGFTVTIGALAGIICNTGLIWIVKLFNWQILVDFVAAIGFVLMFLVWFVFPKHKVSANDNRLIMNLMHVLKNPKTWLIGIICAIMYLPYAIFNDLWGQPFFRVTDHLDKIQAGWVISSIWFGWIIGSPCWGWLTIKQNSLVLPIIHSIFVQLFALFGLIYIHQFSLGFDITMAFALGFSASAMNLCYMLGQQVNPARSSSSSTATINALVTVGTIIYLPLTGLLLNRSDYQSSHISHDVLFIDSSIYINVFSSFIFIMFICLLLSLFLNKLNPAYEVSLS